MPISKGKNNLGEFNHVTFKQIKQLKELHPVVYKSIPDEKFRRLLTCPDINEDFPCFFYVADERRIYSHLSAFPDKLSVDGKIYPWAWTGDLVTDPVYRGRGLAKRVVEETIKVLHGQDLIAAGGFATEVTIHIYKKLGFELPGHVSRHLLLKTARPVLEYHVKSKPIRFMANFLYRALILFWGHFILILTKLKKNKVFLDQVNIHDDTIFNNDLPRLCYRAKYHFNDSLSKIIWKIKWGKPETSLYLLKDEATKKPLCYFVIRKKEIKEAILGKYRNFYLMTLMDFGFFTEDAKVYKKLINKVFSMFWKSEADVLELVSSSKMINGYVKRLGMIEVGKGVPFMFTLPPRCHIGHHR